MNHARSAVFTFASEEDADAWQNSKALAGLPGVYAKGVAGKAHGFEFLASHGDTMTVFFAEYLRRRVPPKPKAEAAKLEAAAAPAAPEPAKKP